MAKERKISLMPTITTINGSIQTAKLKQPFTTAKHTVVKMDSVYVTIELNNGLVGHGAATPNEIVTGDTLIAVMDVINNVLAPALVGLNFEDWNDILTIVKTTILYNGPAKAAIEITLYDLQSQLFQVPLVVLLGARPHSITTDFTVGIASTDEMIMVAKQKVATGFTALKIKLGTETIAKDIARVQQIYASVGAGIHLRLDANQAWSTKESINAAQLLGQLEIPIDFIEQPVKATNIDGLKRVTEQSTIPIMVDECVHTFEDAVVLVADHACDYINIELMKSGGLSEAEKINAVCESNGVACMVGCMIESQVSLAAAVAFAASHANIRFVDLDAVYLSEEQVDSKYFTLHQNQIRLNTQPGL